MYSSSSSSISGPFVSSVIRAAVFTADLVLLDRVDILVLLFAVSRPTAALSAFLLGGVAAGTAGWRARSSMAFLELTKASEASRMAQLPLNLDS